MAEPLNKTVLVVDDEPDVRAFLSAALIEAGFTVMTAEDGFEAMDKVKKSPPDLISLDLVMPKQSGVRFHRELLKDKRFKDIPVLIVTGHARDELGQADLRELTMSGPGIYLEKPVKPENYIAAIKKILGLDTSDDEAKRAEAIELQNELKNLVDAADPETLKRLKSAIQQAETKRE